VVTLHGGSVEAFSDGAEQGSEFVVRLPCTTHTMQRAKRGHTQNARTGRDWRVLLVDDNRDAADTCASLLELSGQQVRTAYSGRAALELAENFRPHMVVLDIGLPDLDGYLVAENIRSTTWGNTTMLVAVTGWGREDDRKRAFAAGFNHHLTKPITAEALESLLHSLSESLSDSTRHSQAGDPREQQR
jgi:CheY-like chemotaxis protein